MKTVLLKNSSNEVAIKADIFATNAEILTPGFDTRCTAMEIVDTEAAIALGLNINEKDYSFRDFVDLAEDINGTTLTVFDYTGPHGDPGKLVKVTISGTSGTATITIDGTDYTVTFDTNLVTTIAGFVAAEAANILAAHDVEVTSDGVDTLLFKATEEDQDSTKAKVDFTLSVANTTLTLDGTAVEWVNKEGSIIRIV